MNDKKYVVMAVFDEQTTQEIYDLRKRLFDSNTITADHAKTLSDWPPHITIAAYDSVDIDELLQWTEEFSKNYSSFDIVFSSLGIFPPGGENTETALLFAAPSQSKALVNFYYAFHEKLDDYCGNIGWLYSAKFGYPAMHSTIAAVNMAFVQKATETVFRCGIFGKVRITALEVYTYPAQLIKRFDLMANMEGTE
jgi:2'-5' RNA ligase